MIYALKITQTPSHDLNLQGTIPSSFLVVEKFSRKDIVGRFYCCEE